MTGYLDANDTPGRHPPSWYAETAGEIPERPALSGAVRADVAILGGGYAGLSAALHLAEAGVDVALVEANRMGWGASGRNGGQLGVGPRAEMEAYEKHCGRETARRVWDVALAANRLVRDLVARHGIDCDLTDGMIDAAWRPAHFRDLIAGAEHLARAYDHPVEVLDRAALAARLGTDRYHGGTSDPTGGHLHPLRLSLGLARAAEAAGARLFERSRVTRIAPGRIETATGAIAADHVLVAANGYLDGLVPKVARKSMPINNFIVATAPLTGTRAERILPGRDCACDTRFVLNYWRRTACDRILWGGGESYGRRFPADIARLVRGKMREIYPDLADIPITHAWGGTLAITGTRFPAFQRLEGGLWSISGWSGSGIHMGVMGGRIAAEAIRGETAAWDLMAALPTPPFPGGSWFRAPMLAAAMTWYSLRDRL